MLPPDPDLDDARRAERLRALGHPARLAILRELASRGTCLCGELVELTPLAQSTVSQHLKVLKEAGLIRGRIEGPRSCYRLDTEALHDMAGDMAALFALLTAPDAVPVLTSAQDTLAERPSADRRPTRTPS